jgi:PIN domain nuclease of toxin-antitoxin system
MGLRIPKKVAKRIEAAGQANQLFISAITPWEIALGVRRGRIKIAGEVLAWIADALDAL